MHRELALEISLIQVDSEESSKHCIAVGISRRLAGYWEKFSISNHHVSVELHRLCHCAKADIPLRKPYSKSPTRVHAGGFIHIQFTFTCGVMQCGFVVVL